MTTFTFYCDLQAHIAALFDKQCADQTLPQEAFWGNLRTSTEPTEYRRRADAFIDGLQHNFPKLRLLDSEYLIDGVWLPISETPAARLRDADCRIVWTKTGAIYGEIPRHG